MPHNPLDQDYDPVALKAALIATPIIMGTIIGWLVLTIVVI